MAISRSLLGRIEKISDPLLYPVHVIWPMPGNPAAQISFASFSEWSSFVLSLSLREEVPEFVAKKFEQSQKLLLLACIDYEFLMDSETLAWIAFEFALTDRYGGKVRRKNGSIHFADALRYMVEGDDLTDEKIPLNQRSGGGKVVGFLTGESKPSLAQRRNGRAHGAPFGESGAGMPCSGLLELIRDLIDYAYRNWAKEGLNGFPHAAGDRPNSPGSSSS